jgi:hypothetical protein
MVLHDIIDSLLPPSAHFMEKFPAELSFEWIGKLPVGKKQFLIWKVEKIIIQIINDDI